MLVRTAPGGRSLCSERKTHCKAILAERTSWVSVAIVGPTRSDPCVDLPGGSGENRPASPVIKVVAPFVVGSRLDYP